VGPVADAWVGRDAGRWAGHQKEAGRDYQWALVHGCQSASDRGCRQAVDVAAGCRGALVKQQQPAVARPAHRVAVDQERQDAEKAHRRGHLVQLAEVAGRAEGEQFLDLEVEAVALPERRA